MRCRDQILSVQLTRCTEFAEGPKKMLRNLKSLAEAGEIPTTRPQPAAREDKD